MTRKTCVIVVSSILTMGSAMAQSDERPLPTGMRDNPRVAAMKYEKTDMRGKNYFLYLQGKRTKLSMATGLDASPPRVMVGRLPDGTLYGTVSRVESGAYLMSESSAFFKRGNAFLQRDECEVEERKGSRILLSHVQRGPWTEKGNAYLYRQGRILDIGFAANAFLKNDGTVAGFYYSNEDKTPFEGLLNEAQSPVYTQYFEFQNGIRTLKGRKKRE